MPALTVPPGVEGIVSLHELPDPEWESRWTRIFVAAGIKDRLLNFTLFSLRHRGKVDGIRVPIRSHVRLNRVT